MPKKGGKKAGGKGKKKKAPTYHTSAADTLPFQLRVNDIVHTPLGLNCTVIGVKYDDLDSKTSGRLWVRYCGGHEAPLEPRMGQGSMANLGYRKCSESDHIRRDIALHEKIMKEEDKTRRIAEENAYRASIGLPPIVVEKPTPKGKKRGGGSKGKAKKKKK